MSTFSQEAFDTDLTIGNPDGSPISFTTIIEKKPVKDGE